MKAARETSHAMQRVKVGMIGLAAVVVLIGLAMAILGTATRERPVVTAGAPADVAANLALANMDVPGEPLAELGVAPAATNEQVADAAR